MVFFGSGIGAPRVSGECLGVVLRQTGHRQQDHAPHPLNYEKVSRTICLQHVLTMVLRLDRKSETGMLGPQRLRSGWVGGGGGGGGGGVVVVVLVVLVGVKRLSQTGQTL